MSEDAVDRMVREWTVREPGRDVTPLEVVGRLLIAAGQLQRDIVAALRPLHLSYGDFDVLNTLRRRGPRGGVHAGDLAKASLITTGAMTSRLDRLENAGHIRRTTDRHDRRGVIVHLTAKGERLAKQALDAVLTVDRDFLEPLDGEGRTALAATLKQLLVRRG
ncbi:MarR family winged helix-turn-helix transcriptional regulator [Amycolatopsis suaedae]|uniref:MarR family transcriptional regulator n=1 Tax=Amycolatopsis suaedae TaxID=2510978 RepID=A0A4Q7J7X3_9PSEU|nr:MarR family transcriptional regulator [Amycolatopsis suaedae]RZQ62463.1 MarR family transcriptional regulator [Amycolatopsis suaedae]